MLTNKEIYNLNLLKNMGVESVTFPTNLFIELINYYRKAEKMTFENYEYWKRYIRNRPINLNTVRIENVFLRKLMTNYERCVK